MVDPLPKLVHVYLPEWAYDQLETMLRTLSNGDSDADDIDSSVCDDILRVLGLSEDDPMVPAAVYGSLAAALAQANLTRDAAQLEATRQTLMVRELRVQYDELIAAVVADQRGWQAKIDRLTEQYKAALLVGDTAWEYLNQTIGPCEEGCTCILHDFEKAQAAGVAFTTKPLPVVLPCTCHTVTVLFGPNRHVWNSACRRHTVKPADFGNVSDDSPTCKARI